jgi:septal ring factor EnvC (AmiA/AmiB activator)
MADVPAARLPWTIVAASVLSLGLLFYTLFGGYVPAKRRVADLELELRQLHAREAELQAKAAQNEQRQTVRERELIAVSAERDALARRLEELEHQLTTARTPRR